MLSVVYQFILSSFLSLRRIPYSLPWIGVVGFSINNSLAVYIVFNFSNVLLVVNNDSGIPFVSRKESKFGFL